ncbi:MAG: hypothetical protein HZY75_13145 [Nocardioidaceae bacterium]|nr:MAG: hypothetical protein HZY75_13145 [Nocardioidaceae bacterium]
MAMTIERTIVLVEMRCGVCDISFAVPDYLQRECMETGRTWYCPNGHPRVYATTENARLRKESERLQAQLVHARDQRDAAERSNVALRGVVTKKSRELSRVSKGVCPCCNRSFANLRRHMAGQHPDYEPT